MHKPRLIHLIFLITFFLVSGCGGNGSQVAEPSNPQIQVDEVNNSGTSYDEIIHLNNCGGKGEIKQIKSRSFNTNIDISPEIKVGYVVIEGSLSAKYGWGRQETASIELPAPSGTNMEFVLKWSENIYAGNVTVDGVSGTTYEVHIPVGVELVSSRDLGNCGNGIIQSPPQVATQPNVIMSQTELLGEWLYQQPRAPMPAPAGENQVIFAHGDINNTGTCRVKEFKAGETVQGLGLGGFKLWLITGTSEYIRDVEAQLQSGAAAHAGTDCPYLP